MKKYQHYVPKFILKKFVRTSKDKKSEGSLKIFDKKSKTYLKRANSLEKGMAPKYFYEHALFAPNEIENLLAERENFYAAIIEKLISRENISELEFDILLEFRHVTYYRSSEFIAFHAFKKHRGKNSWLQRAEWRMINGLYRTGGDYKKTQLNAIKRTIEGTEPVLQVSKMSPVCFVFESKKETFIIGDNGSIPMGGELDGIAIIVISPNHALMFPKSIKAIELRDRHNVQDGEPLLIYELIDSKVVDLINNRVRQHAYEYWIEAR